MGDGQVSEHDAWPTCKLFDVGTSMSTRLHIHVFCCPGIELLAARKAPPSPVHDLCTLFPARAIPSNLSSSITFSVFTFYDIARSRSLGAVGIASSRCRFIRSRDC